MKVISVVKVIPTVLWIALLASGCSEKNAPVSPKAVESVHPLLPPPPPSGSGICFNIWGLDNPDYRKPYDTITNYGPLPHYGWQVINLNLLNPDDNNFDNAYNAGYAIVGVLDKPSIINHHITDEIYSEVSYGKQHHVWWFYVDEAASSRQITKAQIDSVAYYVHLAPSSFLTTAEYDSAAMQDSLYMFDNVDIINPFKYEFTFSHLSSFFAWVHSTFPGKQLVPILAYNVHIGNGTYSQLSEWIEMAAQYKIWGCNIIEYYYEGDQYNTPEEKRRELTSYLQTYYSLGNGTLP